jgi:acetylornithine deacetylase/succinyl-diaminopimelate desuccinylase-like protein
LVDAAAERALGKAFPGLPIAHIRAGGSIPIVPEMTRLLGAPAVLMGFGLPDENAHAPNERLWLPNFFGGIRALIHLYEELASAG